MKKTIITLLLFSCVFFYSQQGYVGIGIAKPQVTLDVVGKPTDTTYKDGIIAPRLTGAQLRAKTYTTAQTGAFVYITEADPSPNEQTQNVNSSGYYYFDGSKWIPFLGESLPNYNYNTGFNSSILGYVPEAVSVSPALLSAVNLAGTTLTNIEKKKCVQWSIANGGNDHWYCLYESSNTDGLRWTEAFEASRLTKGYLPTILSQREMDFINTNLRNDSSIVGNDDSIWIGYHQSNKTSIDYDSDPAEYFYTWITGERSSMNWLQTPNTTAYHFFDSGEPTEGSQNATAILPKSLSPEGKWYDQENDAFSGTGIYSRINYRKIIVEYNN